ncbi:MAG: 16S rRNA (cytosine(1402)-N(4))-methyltransferase RsmH [Proteobacteria bacterium]|jgi:16S rRNA (cytosine1402-N4)-methyltransferase|nr:16S rRNA (cytosine(1402)-N(4))-methyltransferase RsmH [Pseudomonadota bacterium]
MDAPFDHQPVALDTILELLAPQPGETFCDATIGGGGHAERVLEATAPDGRLLGIDRDLEAVDAATRRLERFGDRVVVRHGRFSDLERLMAEAGMAALDGLVLDLGVSSHQLDAARRGFSFVHDGPLDMRMDTTSGETAAALLARTSEDDLADLVFRFGGERYSRRVARSIKRMEEAGGLATTADLAVAVRRVMGPKRAGGIDPATRTFQAIRIAVNDELGELERLLDALPAPLAVGGRVAVISFHSLEDGLVKRRFADLVSPCRCPPGIPVCDCPAPFAEYVTRRSVRVTARERAANPRSRSAKVRAIRRVR